MSRVKVNEVTNKLGVGPVDFPDGITGVALTVTGNVTVGGTIISEDTTNVDSVGWVTARSGLNVGPPATGIGATIHANGDAVFAGVATATSFSGSATGLTGSPDITVNNATVTKQLTAEHASITGITTTPNVRSNTQLKLTALSSTYFDGPPLIERAKHFGVTLSSRQDTGHTNLLDGNIFKYTGNETDSTLTINLRGDGSTTLASLVSDGDNIATTTIIYPNGTGLITVINIDGVAQTIEWSGGSAPSAGAGGVDIYNINLFRTGSGTTDWLVTAACTNYA